jgi:hypothetical protein
MDVVETARTPSRQRESGKDACAFQGRTVYGTNRPKDWDIHGMDYLQLDRCVTPAAAPPGFFVVGVGREV